MSRSTVWAFIAGLGFASAAAARSAPVAPAPRFGIHRLAKADPYPHAVTLSLDQLASGNAPAGWGVPHVYSYGVASDGTHYLVLHDREGASIAALLARPGPPPPVLAPGEMLACHGEPEDGGKPGRRYECFAIERQPVLTASDVTHCEVEVEPSCTTECEGALEPTNPRCDHPRKRCTSDPVATLRLTWSAAAEQRFARLKESEHYFTAFGEELLTAAPWTARFVPRFEVPGRDPVAQAQAMIPGCIAAPPKPR